MEAVILSSWDYIMGPQIERLWMVNNDPKPTSSDVPTSILTDFNASKHYKKTDIKGDPMYLCNLKIYSFMCGQLLLGEMDATETIDENTSRTYISDIKILIGVVFRMKSWIYVGTVKEVKNVCLCFGIVYKRDAFSFILNNQFTLDIYLRKLVDILQKTKLPYESVFNELSNNVLQVISLLDSLYHNLDNIQNYILSSIQDYSISGVLPEAIVSHLQTSGRTTVLGSSEFKIKQIINILSLFSNKEDLCCSLTENPWILNSKVSAFYIQGIIKRSEKDSEHLLEQAYDESLSLTVIDTDLCRVWQTYPFHTNDEKTRIFSPVTEAGGFVPELLKDLSFADKNDVDCRAIIENFTKLLMIKAVALVKTVAHFRDIKKVLSKEELMVLFATYTLVDLQILLGCAEKVRPGIRCLVL